MKWIITKRWPHSSFIEESAIKYTFESEGEAEKVAIRLRSIMPYQIILVKSIPERSHETNTTRRRMVDR